MGQKREELITHWGSKASSEAAGHAEFQNLSRHGFSARSLGSTSLPYTRFVLYPGVFEPAQGSQR
ncbi:hypothetical protein SAMN05444745_1165 [Arthrobacter sp. OV608]|nr:hypothetical protein SAMN05444745_1165 [Arthrobacter sp. OV608]